MTCVPHDSITQSVLTAPKSPVLQLLTPPSSLTPGTKPPWVFSVSPEFCLSLKGIRLEAHTVWPSQTALLPSNVPWSALRDLSWLGSARHFIATQEFLPRGTDIHSPFQPPREVKVARSWSAFAAVDHRGGFSPLGGPGQEALSLWLWAIQEVTRK